MDLCGGIFMRGWAVVEGRGYIVVKYEKDVIIYKNSYLANFTKYNLGNTAQLLPQFL